MDTRSQEILNKILAKDINDLNDPDKKFLRARKAYLTDEQIKKYIDIEVKEEVEKELPYEELLQKAKDLGFNIPKRLPRKELDKMIASKNVV